MEGIMVEWFQMVMDVYLLWKLASICTYLLLPVGAILMFCIWGEKKIPNSLRALLLCIYFS
jgi:hypothetical protein